MIEISEDVLQQVIADAVQNLTARQNQAAGKTAADLDELEREELKQVRAGDHRKLTDVQLKFARLRREATNPPKAPEPVAPIDQQALQAEFDQRAKGLRGIEFVNLKMQYRRRGLEIN